LREQLSNLRANFEGGGPGRGGGGGGNGAREQDGGGDFRAGRHLGKAEHHAEGRFRATGLQEGVYELQLQSPDHARYRSPSFELRTGGAAVQLDVRLDGGVFIAGRVLDAFDQPVANARVELRSPSAWTAGRRGRAAGGAGGAAAPNGAGNTDWNGIASDFARQMAGAGFQLDATTGVDGDFVLKHVPRGSYRMTADADGHARASLATFELTTDRSGLELKLGPLGAIAGLVSGVLPDELATARVAVVPMPSPGTGDGAGNDSGFGAMLPRRAGGGRDGPFATAEVGADGSYRLANLTPGAYLVRAYVGSAQDLMRQLMPAFFAGSLVADVEVTGGKDARFDLAVTRPQLGEVAGTVLHNGVAGAGLRVELQPADDSGSGSGNGPGAFGAGRGGRGPFGAGFGGGRSYQATVSTTGQFRIGKVPVGAYSLRVANGRGGGGALLTQPVQVTTATSEVALTVTTHALVVRVRSASGEAVDSRGVALLMPPGTDDADRRSGFQARIEAGRAEFRALPPGVYALTVQVAGQRNQPRPIDIPGNAECEVTIEATPAPNDARR
jgi:hypothetical protein